MVKRKKRLEKGVISLNKQIEIHKKKMEIAKELGQEELVNYYTKEMEALTKRKLNRESKSDNL